MWWLSFKFLLYSATFITFVSSHNLPLLQDGQNVGTENCNQGQIFWCQNVRTATVCAAVKHCIQGVWELEVPIEKDKSEICQVCLDMVKQARDQLESNETQEDIKAVLDGTCMLIPVKAVKRECIKLMDDFAPQLVDMLASQMNPQVVCSVAGLCNNNRVAQLEQKYYQKLGTYNKKNKLDCNSCFSIVDYIKEKVTLPPNNLLQLLVELCGHAGSFSDGCATLVANHLTSIQSMLEENLHGAPVCSLAGVCKHRFHNHANSSEDAAVETSVSIFATADNDLPCDLCVQLVVHLKDILIANTTEEEFQMVLKGLCQQMSAYKNECLELVKDYYTTIYAFLVEEMDGKLLCQQIKICPASSIGTRVLRPLLITDTESKNDNAQQYQLPVELINPFMLIPSSVFTGVKNSDVQSKTVCQMCEYFLHFVQQELTLPSSEKEIRRFVMQGCDLLPKHIAPECNSFVEQYADAFIALLANRIDPSQVCPSLGVCPGDLIAIEYKDKPTCPLCLFAMQEVLTKVHNNTLDEISDVLDDLCMRDVFPNSLSTECVKFVGENRRAIVEMVIAEFTAQESCVYINLCIPPDFNDPVLVSAGNIETNEISEVPIPDEIPEVDDPKTCTLCKFVMTKLDDILKEPKTQEEIKDAVYNVCSHMPKVVSQDCKKFVMQYADLVIELIIQGVEPKEICTAFGLCDKMSDYFKNDMEKCLVCELLMDGLRTVLTDKEVDDNLNRRLEEACEYVPSSKRSLCLNVVEQLAPQIEMALRSLPVGPMVCKRVNMCSEEKAIVRLLSPDECQQGPSYWCQSTAVAASCSRIEYCQMHVWRADKPRKSHNKGQIVIKY